jgi:hypothetical protein
MRRSWWQPAHEPPRSSGWPPPSSREAVTFVFDAPQRRVTIRRHALVPDTLIVTGFEERAYKDYKIYEVS